MHTPDGGPCGLLNHITISCRPLPADTYNANIHTNIELLCVRNGMILISDWLYIDDVLSYVVMVNGKHVGYIEYNQSDRFVDSLKVLKVRGLSIPKLTLIAYLKRGKFGNSIFPMIFISTGGGRFLRPVNNLALSDIEWISPL